MLPSLSTVTGTEMAAGNTWTDQNATADCYGLCYALRSLPLPLPFRFLTSEALCHQKRHASTIPECTGVHYQRYVIIDDNY